LPVERLVPSQVPSTFSAASEAVPCYKPIFETRVDNRDEPSAASTLQ
jgi:hypothetical protein